MNGTEDGENEKPDWNTPELGGTDPKEYERLNNDIEKLMEEAEEVVEGIHSDDEEIKILEKRIKAIRDRKTKHEERRFDINQDINKNNRALEALKRQLALEAEARRVRALADERRRSLDEVTQDAKWRDFILPHQLDGAHYLAAAQRAVCADEPGTGKTLQMVAVIDFLFAAGDGGIKTLIAMPNEVISGFETELHRWSDVPVVNLAQLGTMGVVEAIDLYDPLLSRAVYLINYEMLARSEKVVERLTQVHFDTVVCDEAHNIKETDRNTYLAIEKIVLSHNTCPICGKHVHPMAKNGENIGLTPSQRQGLCPDHAVVEECIRSVKNYFSMTGTLILNRPDEAFASLHLVNDRLFPYRQTFRDDYCYQDWNNKWVWKQGGESRLAAKIKGMYIRRTKTDAGIILPPQTVIVHEVEVNSVTYPRQTILLETLAKNAQMEIDEGRVATFFGVLPLITRQRQAAVWPGGIYLTKIDPITGEKYRDHIGNRYLESAKLDRAVSLFHELTDEGEARVVFFSQFREPLIELGKRLGDDVVEYHGGTPKNIRKEIKKNFDRKHLELTGEKSKWKGVLAHYKLGGEGLNLTAATHVIVLDSQWNPGKEQQAYDRVNRLGQTEETTVHIIELKGSIDLWMRELVESKRKIVDGFHAEVAFQDIVDIFKMGL